MWCLHLRFHPRRCALPVAPVRPIAPYRATVVAHCRITRSAAEFGNDHGQLHGNGDSTSTEGRAFGSARNPRGNVCSELTMFGPFGKKPFRISHRPEQRPKRPLEAQWVRDVEDALIWDESHWATVLSPYPDLCRVHSGRLSLGEGISHQLFLIACEFAGQTVEALQARKRD